MTAIRQLLKHGRGRTLFGQRIEQTWSSLWVIERLLADYEPDRIVELGTGGGMLARYLKQYVELSNNVNPAKLLTIDLDTSKAQVSPIKADKNDLRVDIWQVDIHEPKTLKAVARFMRECGRIFQCDPPCSDPIERPFLIVDGADPKSFEVNLYAPHMPAGCPIFAHDCQLDGVTSKKPGWCFVESQIDWQHVERFEPYYSMSVEMDTRMLCLRKKL